MANKTPVHYFPATIALLLTSMLVLTSTAAPPPPSPSGCSDQVLAFSPCLPYISDPPNNVSNAPSSQCCDVFGSAFDAGEANCLCYLIRRPLIFGFPLNRTKLYSLSSFCPVIDTGMKTNSSLKSLCTGSKALPPLQSTTGSGLSTSHSSVKPAEWVRRNSLSIDRKKSITNDSPLPKSGELQVQNGSSGNSLPPSTNLPLPESDDDSLPPESSDDSPLQPSTLTPVMPTNRSSASGKLYKSHNWFQRHTMILIVTIFFCL